MGDPGRQKWKALSPGIPEAVPERCSERSDRVPNVPNGPNSPNMCMFRVSIFRTDVTGNQKGLVHPQVPAGSVPNDVPNESVPSNAREQHCKKPHVRMLKKTRVLKTSWNGGAHECGFGIQKCLLGGWGPTWLQDLSPEPPRLPELRFWHMKK